MAKVKEDFKIEMKLKGIEMLNGSLQLPSNQDLNITNFNFNINIESKADAPNKIVFVIVNIEIKNEVQSVILGSISVSCIYEILNFVDVIKISTDGKLDIPQALIEVLNSISISTTRGVMFSTFKGTFLHNAVLPIIDPRQFQFAD
jgi:hypothetical protein